MPAKYLGTIGSVDAHYGVYLFTAPGLSCGRFSASEVADGELFLTMQRERYSSLVEGVGRAIFCTAINPNHGAGVETNFHDDKPGTFHIVTIPEERISDESQVEIGRPACFLSVSVDTPEMYHGRRVGLPMENRIPDNGYPEGGNLDRFRERYPIVRGLAGLSKDSWMCELYRHIRINGAANDPVSRLGTYVGAYHVCVRDPRNTGGTQTPVWLFDAVPRLFDKYRWAGAARLRDWTVADHPRSVSPASKDIITTVTDDGKVLMYNGEVISRDVIVPIPQGDGTLKKEVVPFLDGVIDIHMVEKAIENDPKGLSDLRYEGISDVDISFLSVSQTIFAKRLFDQKFAGNDDILSFAKDNREILAPIWNFNGVGK